MSLRYAALSLVALSLIVLLSFKNYETWTRPIEITPERAPAKKQEAKIETPAASSPQKVPVSAQAKVVIAGKNIFSPDRKDFPVQSAESRKIVRPQVVLYGVTIGEGYEFASIVTPGRSLHRGERETLMVKVGEKVGDYKLARISADRITLEAEGDAFEVLLYDPKAPKKRIEVKTETKPATVTSSQTSPPAGTAATTGPVPTPSPAPPAASRMPAPVPQVVPPPVATPSTPPTSPYLYRRGRIPPAGLPSETPPTGGVQPGTTPAPAGQPPGSGGN